MNTLRLTTIAALAATVLFACRKDEDFTEDPVTLDFSQDTVLYDTIFTTVGSITKRFTVRNTSDQAVRVDVALEGGTPSPFRLNVDGASGITFEDVEVLGGDSFYVFVEATLGEGGVNTPFVIEDHVLFNTNGSEQSVLLVAWGQDAHFFRPNHDGGGFPNYSVIAGEDDLGNVICEEVTWVNDKPYVIYGYGVVDSCSTLKIDPGVRVYMHGGSGLWVYRHGRIEAEGTVTDRITFQGDRLEPLYQDLPGQWDRIWINDGPDTANRFINVEIRNALIGIQCETAPWLPGEPTSARKLVLNNVSIRNCSAAGILSRNYAITSNNLLVADCGQYCLALTGGGRYYFNHSTIANYWSWEMRNTPAFVMTNTFQDINGVVQVRAIENGEFRNGSIYGYNTNEFLLEFDNSVPPLFQFHHFIIRTDQSTSDAAHFPDQASIFRNLNPGFADGDGGDFHLATDLSNAVDRGTSSMQPIEAIRDLDGELRGDGQPDLGCYEFLP